MSSGQLFQLQKTAINISPINTIYTPDVQVSFCHVFYIFILLDQTSDLTQQYMADARIYIKQNGVSGIQKFLREKLERTKDVKIRFGITGDSGTGKSAFINAIRG